MSANKTSYSSVESHWRSLPCSSSDGALRGTVQVPGEKIQAHLSVMGRQEESMVSCIFLDSRGGGGGSGKDSTKDPKGES